MIPEAVREILSLPALTLATSGPDGLPHAAAVYFATLEEAHPSRPAFRLFFFSEAKSLHARHLAHQPRAAAAIYPECEGWQDIRGLQMHGDAHPLPAGEAWDLGWHSYREKFPFVAALKPVVARNTLYVFIPSWLRLVDNRRSFGYKQEWDLT